MKVTEFIENNINRLPKGYVFTYIDMMQDESQKEAVIKALNRKVKSGKIAKLSKGKYYKPENTPFGNLLPDQKQVVKDLLEENSKVTGYLTGYSIYNQLGLTTQVSNTVQIGRNEIRPSFKRGQYTISFIKQKNTISKDNIPMLQLLDAIRYIKKIPDTSIDKSIKRLMAILNKLSEKEKMRLNRLALKYPPSTRALLGAMLEYTGGKRNTEMLLRSLNPITKYRLTGVTLILPTAEKWNMV
ncbi:MAG TPA: hypothetical protein ENN33_06340 [Ignavibacteria bacterium]|nr:hypothetical protein [Ignavibacteria bacterium]